MIRSGTTDLAGDGRNLMISLRVCGVDGFARTISLDFITFSELLSY